MFTTSIIGASLLGILVACWNYIKGFLVQLSGRLIGRIEVDYPLANTILPYVVHKYKQSRFSPQKFYSNFEFVRPIGRTQIVAGETINNQGNLFWNKWFPIWISKTFNKDLNENNVGIAYLRGTLNAENFLVSAMDYFNERILEQKTNRFNITNIFGTDGKPANLNIGSGSGVEPSRNSYDYNLAKCSKLLKWNKEDIGQDNRDIGNSVNKLSLNKKALELVKECGRWKNNRDWFRHKGIPWKMGATLYGCPGTGKSALISAIAKDLDMPIFIYSLATLFDDELFKEWKKMLAETPMYCCF